jgi:hypothetical protein
VITQTPAEVLDTNVVLTPAQIAYVAGLLHRRGEKKGQPDRRAALELIKAGTLPLVDPNQPITRWTVSSVAVRKYLGAA